jgi:hypothetical protein
MDKQKLYEEDLPLFPDIEQYKQQLDILKEVTEENTPFEKLRDKYFDLAVILPQMIAFQTPDVFNKHKLFRVRLNIDETKEDVRLIQTHSYPPGHVCVENARANLKGKSVFYCSNNPTAALLESKPKVGDIAYISIWKPKTTRNTKIALCLPFNLKSENDAHVLSRQAWVFAEQHYEAEARNKSQHFIELNKFLAERYVKESKPYYLTSWLSDEILYGEHWRDLILYPSIASNTDYCNMAIHPNFVNQFVDFDRILRVKIIGVDGNQIAFNMGPVGIIQNSNIEWMKPTNKEEVLLNDFGFELQKSEK